MRQFIYIWERNLWINYRSHYFGLGKRMIWLFSYKKTKESFVDFRPDGKLPFRDSFAYGNEKNKFKKKRNCSIICLYFSLSEIHQSCSNHFRTTKWCSMGGTKKSFFSLHIHFAFVSRNHSIVKSKCLPKNFKSKPTFPMFEGY